tara:strand:+ start:215 stop:421 length:207 start_codon:yes stop_codon:yes gene_type:complete
MIQFLFYYAIGGFLFNLMWDLTVSFLVNKGLTNETTRLKGLERLIVGFIWPYGLALFIYHLIRALNEK